jgi:hypothetical protein
MLPVDIHAFNRSALLIFCDSGLGSDNIQMRQEG